MRLRVINSGSAGNGYLLRSKDGFTLLIECGVPFGETLAALDFDTSKVVGCIVSHEHGDHAGYIRDYARHGICIYGHHSLSDKLPRDLAAMAFQALEPATTYKIAGGFDITPLAVEHDVVCYAYLVRHREMGTLLFCTDTMMLEHRLPQVNHYMIECDYDDESLAEAIEDGRAPALMKERLMRTHMELQTTIGVLRANDLSETRDIVLIHLSATNADPERMVREVERATGIPTITARDAMFAGGFILTE